jgi:hypothetical protein
VDSLAFYNLVPYINLPAGECVALIDVGHEKTSVCIVQDGVLRMFRSINLGGRYITEFLARDLETDFPEAQRVKHRVSRVFCETDEGKDLSPDDHAIAKSITLAANAIVKELGRTFFAFKNWEKAPISRIILSGGTSSIKNFDVYLSEQFEITTTRNRLDETGLKINPALASRMDVLPQSVAIGMRAVGTAKRHSQINLRQGEFAFVQNYESLLKAASSAFRVVGVALLLLCVSYGVKYWFYQQQINQLQSEYLKAYTAIFPSVKNQFIPGKFAFEKLRADSTQKLQKEISIKREAVRTFVEENAPSPALLVLKELSEVIPKETKLDVTLYQFNALPTGGGKLVLRGETDSYATVDKIVESVKNAKLLKGAEAKQSGAKPGSDNKIIEFTIHAEYIREGAAQGKS